MARWQDGKMARWQDAKERRSDERELRILVSHSRQSVSQNDWQAGGQNVYLLELKLNIYIFSTNINNCIVDMVRRQTRPGVI